jgi:sn-glycerol 3-phosphate transport system substrate-binding protein
LGGILENVAAGFNASQSKYQVNATFKGSYPETMVAAIAAFRAGNAPHIVQMFEVGTRRWRRDGHQAGVRAFEGDRRTST